MEYILTMGILGYVLVISAGIVGRFLINSFKNRGDSETFTEKDKSNIITLCCAVCILSLLGGMCLGSMFTEIVSL